MLSSIVNWILPWASTSDRPAFFISGKHSAFSGIVSEVSLGGPAKLPVSIDFSSSRSYMYGRSACPPSVFPCYDSSTSETFQHEGGLASDRLTVGDFVLDDFKFSIVAQSRVPSVNDREVAGVLGFSRRSQIMASRSIALMEQGGCFESLLIQAASAIEPTSTAVDFPFAHSISNWVILAVISINGKYCPYCDNVPVLFDPSEQGILFPRSMEAFVRSALGKSGYISGDNYMFADCEQSIPISLQSYAQKISLASNLFRFESSGRGICKTNLRVSNAETPIVIGRMLTRSVSAVILDSSSEYLKIIPFTEPKAVPRFYAPIPLAPVYELPFVDTGFFSSGLVFATKSDSQGGLLTVSQSVRKIKLPNGRYARGFLFLRTTHTDQEATEVTKLLPKVGILWMRTDLERIVMLVEAKGPSDVWMISSFDQIAIVLLPKLAHEGLTSQPESSAVHAKLHAQNTPEQTSRNRFPRSLPI